MTTRTTDNEIEAIRNENRELAASILSTVAIIVGESTRIHESLEGLKTAAGRLQGLKDRLDRQCQGESA